MEVRAESVLGREIDQLRGDVVRVDRAQPQACGRDRRKHRFNQRRQGPTLLPAVGAKVDSGEDDFAIALLDRLDGAAEQRWLRQAAGLTSGAPHDAVGAAMVAAVLHLQEIARTAETGCPWDGIRRKVGGDVVEQFVFPPVGKTGVDAAHGGDPRIGIVNVTPGENEVRLRRPTSQTVDQGSEFAISLGGNGAAVDDAYVGIGLVLRDLEADLCQPIAKLCHLGKVDLASERVQRDLHDCWTRIAAAITPASRARSTRGPRVTAVPPPLASWSSSSADQPPSGPTASATFEDLSCTSRKWRLAPGCSTSTVRSGSSASAAASESGLATDGIRPR